MSAVALAADEVGPVQAPLVVLLHELTEDRHAFDPVLPALAARCRVLAVDLRGHGDSPRGDGFALDDLVADVHALVLDRSSGRSAPLLVGHGFGAFVAADYATVHPALGVVDLDQDLTWLPTARALAGTPGPLDADTVESLLLGPAGYGPLPVAQQARLRALRRLDPVLVAAAWAPLTAGARALSAWTDDVLALPPGVPLLSVLAVDPGKAYVRRLRERVPGARVEGWTPGHYPHLVEPDRFAARVAALASPT